jgi:hypothetical protein
MENTGVNKSGLPGGMSVLRKYGEFIAQSGGYKTKSRMQLDGFFIKVHYSRKDKNVIKIEAEKAPADPLFYFNQFIKTTLSLFINILSI